MESWFWCSTCCAMYANEPGYSDHGYEHCGHDVKLLGGEQVDETVACLDGIIQYGLSVLENNENEVATAKEIKEDIEEIRQKCIDNSRTRIERIVMDLRVAMEDSTAQLLRSLNSRVKDMETKCQAIINRSIGEQESIKGFVREAALTLPDEVTGKLDPNQMGKLFAYYKTVEELARQPRPQVSFVDLNIKYPDSYQRKKECEALAQAISGRIESEADMSVNEGQILHNENEAEVHQKPQKPVRRESRDSLRN